MFSGPFDYSIINRAVSQKCVSLNFINIRNFGIGKHQQVDDTAYGGGLGMVMRVDVLHKAIEHAKQNTTHKHKKHKVILLSASGAPYTQVKAENYANDFTHLILVCGHYEGIDNRILKYVDEEVSIGDFVVTGGEIPAMCIIDSVTRLLPGVLPFGATTDESFSNSKRLLEYPHFTKPQEYDGEAVPDILLSGDHRKVQEWRYNQSMNKTENQRPDLLDSSTKKEGRGMKKR